MLTETRPSFGITNGLNDYGYDLLNRLLSATHPTLPPEAYAYDPVGNRNPSTWQYNAANQLLNDTTFTYTYDANGNQLTRSDGRTYTYSPENQLISTQHSADSTQYTYDGLGRRIQKDVNGVKTRYIYDQEDILLEYDGSNVLKARYLHGAGIDEPLMLERDTNASGTFDATERFVYHPDGLGSITELTDSTGTTTRSYYYDAFGQLANQTGTLLNPYLYTAREYDAETGLSHYRWRNLDHRTGRFLQEDPIQFAGGDKNFYAYAANSPVNLTDPTGLIIPGDPDPSDELLILFMLRAGGRLIGAAITGLTKHGINQIITKGICPTVIASTLRNPLEVLKRIDEIGRVSYRIIGERAVVVINEFGEIVTAWLSGRR